MDVYADRWKALKRTTNQKAIGSNPVGRAIHKQGLQRCCGLFCFPEQSAVLGFDIYFDIFSVRNNVFEGNGCMSFCKLGFRRHNLETTVFGRISGFQSTQFRRK